MSLILEALRKSEAERRRGQVPGLHAEPASILQPMRPVLSPWVWPLLALMALAVLAFVLWTVFRATPAPDALDAPAAVPLTAAPADSTAGDAVPRLPAKDAGSTASVAALPAAPTGAARDALSRSEDLRSPVAGPPGTAEAGATAIGTSARPAAVVTASEGADAVVPARGDAAAKVPTATPSPTPATAAVPRAAAPLPTTATPASAPPLQLSDLDSTQRQQLPPLRMSMHMWAPTQRFAIIDGNRVSEGDRVGEAVVSEITATGVVLDWQGLRLQIPVR